MKDVTFRFSSRLFGLWALAIGSIICITAHLITPFKMTFLTTIAALLGLSATVVAFSVNHPTKVIRQLATSTTVFYHPAAFERAVDCAKNYGMCNVEELLNLAEQLDEYNGCFYEESPEACEKEIEDRRDLVGALLLQSELQCRNDYIKDGNLFVHEVQADKEMHDRDNFIEKIESSLDV